MRKKAINVCKLGSNKKVPKKKYVYIISFRGEMKKSQTKFIMHTFHSHISATVYLNDWLSLAYFSHFSNLLLREIMSRQNFDYQCCTQPKLYYYQL